MKPKKPTSQSDFDQSFFEAIALIETPQEAKAYLQDLCTPAELQAMVDRWQVIDELHHNKSYRSIHADTGISVTTVGRVARCLELGTGGYKTIYERQKKTAPK